MMKTPGVSRRSSAKTGKCSAAEKAALKVIEITSRKLEASLDDSCDEPFCRSVCAFRE